MSIPDHLSGNCSTEKSPFQEEIEAGERFTFGENWREFLKSVNEERIREAELSLTDMLNLDSLDGKSFLDIGSGSGLFSLAARRLGAEVHSFDYDPSSVWSTSELRQRYFPQDKRWRIEHGSVLDEEYLKSLGGFDIVYCWGVLHHTGDLWRAMGLIIQVVDPAGLLFIAVYNDQGILSQFWRFVKRTYCHLPRLFKPLIHVPIGIMMWSPSVIRDLFRLRPMEIWRNYCHSRGMSPWRDVVDWSGGYPFEVAAREDVIAFYETRGFSLIRVDSAGTGLGNNQFVFQLDDCREI
jgi:2-polyprenyl-3-methyl-5-hydroxy-6-metoxy-1,4-benzoquinol methylase